MRMRILRQKLIRMKPSKSPLHLLDPVSKRGHLSKWKTDRKEVKIKRSSNCQILLEEGLQRALRERLRNSRLCLRRRRESSLKKQSKSFLNSSKETLKRSRIQLQFIIVIRRTNRQHLITTFLIVRTYLRATIHK